MASWAKKEKARRQHAERLTPARDIARAEEERGKDGIKGGQSHRIAVYAFLLCICALGALLRWGIVECVRDHYGDVPYSGMSALLFHYADMAARGEAVPAVDRQAEYPEGLEVSRKLPLGKGIAEAALYKAVGSPGSFRGFVRRFDAAWFCLGIVAMFLVVREMGAGELGGLMAAALYAVSLPSVARSTGLEFSSENFSLPLIFVHWWLLERGGKQARLSFSSIWAGVLLAAAAATWDGTQLYILLIGMFAAFKLLFGKEGFGLIRWFLPGLGCLVAAGAVVPYLREQTFSFSWGMLVWYSLAGAFAAGKLSVAREGVPARIGFLVLLVSLVVLVFGVGAYPDIYPVYGRLLLAKVKHLNVKPLDPAKLSLEVRVLWRPESYSATSQLGGKNPLSDFRMLFLVNMVPILLLIRSLLRRHAGESEKRLLFLVTVFFVLYLLFAGMKVFLVFFLCCLSGLGVRSCSSVFRHRTAKGAAVSVWTLMFLMGLVGEVHSSSELARMRRVPGGGRRYYANRELVGWLRKNTEKDAVILADFDLEPTILADARRAIILHPEMKGRRMRLRVKEYLESLFSGYEKDFHDFCVEHGANYFVLGQEAFLGPTNRNWVYSQRYIADRAERYPEYASLAMCSNVNRLQYFKKVTDVSMGGDPFGFFYRVFKVVSEEEIEEAAEYVGNARMYLDNYSSDGDRESLQRAEGELLRAVELFPGSAEAHSMLAHVYTIKKEDNKASQEIERWKQILADTKR